MSFYVTLPSDSSLQYFPENKISHFTTQLPTSIELKGEWEVGLSEIIYPHSWNNINDSNNLFSYEDDSGSVITKHISPGYYNTSEIIRAITAQTPADKIHLKYNEMTKKVKIQTLKGLSIHFGNLSPLLGFPQEKLTGMIKSPFVADPHVVYSFFYVYTDLVVPQIVGDVQAPLLRVVKVNGRNGEVISQHYDRPQYIPIMRHSLQTIDIELRLNSGGFVPFERGKVIIVLHFRMRQIL